MRASPRAPERPAHPRRAADAGERLFVYSLVQQQQQKQKQRCQQAAVEQSTRGRLSALHSSFQDRLSSRPPSPGVKHEQQQLDRRSSSLRRRNEAFLQRIAVWQQRHQERLARAKLSVAEEAIAECTFRPKLSQRPLTAAVAEDKWNHERRSVAPRLRRTASFFSFPASLSPHQTGMEAFDAEMTEIIDEMVALSYSLPLKWQREQQI